MKSIDAILTRAYSNFIYRDLAYVVGGGLILAIPFTLFNIWEFINTLSWWFSILVIMLAYVLGFFALQSTVAMGIYRMYPRGKGFVESEVKDILARSEIDKRWGEQSQLRLERIVVIKHLSASIGSSCFWALVTLQVFYFLWPLNIDLFLYVFLTTSFAFVAIMMGISNWRAASVQAQVIKVWHLQLKNDSSGSDKGVNISKNQVSKDQ